MIVDFIICDRIIALKAQSQPQTDLKINSSAGCKEVSYWIISFIHNYTMSVLTFQPIVNDPSLQLNHFIFYQSMHLSIKDISGRFHATYLQRS